MHCLGLHVFLCARPSTPVLLDWAGMLQSVLAFHGPAANSPAPFAPHHIIIFFTGHAPGLHRAAHPQRPGSAGVAFLHPLAAVSSFCV